MVVEFRGAPPHDLGTAELATVQPADGHIDVELHILDDWHRPTASIVRVQMAAQVAGSLAERLSAAAAEIEARAARSA
jgi:hypothetical protein